MAKEVNLETGEVREVEDREYELTMRESMAFVGLDGRLRCPQCGRFVKSSQRRKGGSFRYAGGIVHVMPHCAHCEKDHAD